MQVQLSDDLVAGCTCRILYLPPGGGVYATAAIVPNATGYTSYGDVPLTVDCNGCGPIGFAQPTWSFSFHASVACPGTGCGCP